MELPRNKTKIVCTIGPASESQSVLRAMLRAGMDIARLNFSHGDFDSHARTVQALREAASATGRRLVIMADLPGPKIRIGELSPEPVELANGDEITLTTDDMVGDARRIPVNLASLPQVVSVDDKLFLNDGLISLRVIGIDGNDVRCEVRAGGELSSRKGLSLPGIDLGFSAFTERDRECLAFAIEQGVDAVSQSFVATAADIVALREAAAAMGGQPFVIAKIERACALDNLDEILQVSDGLMVARGDLGVEVPIAEMAVIQKRLMLAATASAKPVITATQMLESMTEHRRPTRAEATDVANAILDGTDAVMLSAESAVGRYPVEAVAMLAEIAAATEPHRQRSPVDLRWPSNPSLHGLIARSIHQAVTALDPVAVCVPTRSGSMARNVTRFRLPTWITAFSTQEATCQSLQFSYGVFPVKVDAESADWTPFLREWLGTRGVTSGFAILAQGPSAEYPCGNHRMEVVDLELCSAPRA
ncbi:MAG: pyruvate kinase [Gammaproteobacteria bacterium]|nr:pyruvate kinase [Gammaproteobacteria bacterium]